MTPESQMQVHRVQVAQPPMHTTEDQQAAGALAILHKRLRGRYPWAIALATLFGAAASFVGHRSTVPKYTSEAMVRISPTLPRTLYRTEENEIPPLFESFVSAQATFLQSSRVFTTAVEDSELKSTGWPAGSMGISKLKRSVSVGYRRGSQVITVQATVDDPHQAQKAANAVIKAYESLYGEQGETELSQRETRLTARQRSLESQLDGFRKSVLQFGEIHGTDDLEELYRAQLNELLAVRSQRFQQQQIIDQLESLVVPLDSSETQEPDLSLQYLATLDEELGQLLSLRDSLDAEIKSAQRFGPRHIQTRKLEEDRRILDARVESRLEQVRLMVDSGTPLTADSPLIASESSLPQAKALFARLTKSEEELQVRVKELGKTRLQINSLKEDAETARQRLTETAQALEQLTVEKENIQQGRVSLIEGDYPTQPSHDRRFQLAVAGALGGAGVGIGLVLLMGLLRPSYRYLDEIEEAESLVPVLGTLPNLNSTSDELESLASLSVHHLRNMLSMQARPRKDGGTAFMVTSARPGDGKTSLTVALGMSFAAQGIRALIIDADLVGHGLSPTMQMADRDGLRQVVREGSLNDVVFPSRIPGLFVLPAGRSSPSNGTGRANGSRENSAEAEQLSPDRMRELVDDARSKFDIVLIDTGPLMGSLEANVVATVVDRVVMTVPRGQDPRLVRAALGRLRSIGATCAGLVFNRAAASDLRSSMSTVSFHSQSMRPEGAGNAENGAESRHALVRAILMSGPPSETRNNGPTT